ncbi:hypothetical protein L9F63_007505, partial [Diploptera punctata]
MKKRDIQKSKKKERNSLNKSDNPPSRSRVPLLQNISWPSTETIRVSDNLLHVLDDSSKFYIPVQHLKEDSSTRSLTLTPRTLYQLDGTFRVPPLRRSEVNRYVDLTESIESSEEQERPFKRKPRTRSSGIQGNLLESVLVNEARKSNPSLVNKTSLDESSVDSTSPVLSNPLTSRFRLRQKKLIESFRFTEVLSEKSPVTPLLRLYVNILQKALEITHSTKSHLTAADSIAEEEDDIKEDDVQIFEKRNKTRKVDASASDVNDVSATPVSVCRKKQKTLTGQDYEVCIEHISLAGNQSLKALEITESTKSRLSAADLPEEEDDDIEEDDAKIFDKKKKTGKADASAFSNVLSESNKSIRRSVLNTSKHQDSASLEEGQESPRQKSQFVRKKQKTLTGQDYEKALEITESTKSRLSAADLPEEEDDDLEEDDVQIFDKKKKTRKADDSAFSNVLSESNKSVRRSVLNTSKHQDSASIGEGQESPRRRPQFVRKKQQTLSEQEYEKALEITESTKSHLSAADSIAEKENDFEEIDNFFNKKKKTRKSDTSAFSNVLNESDKSVRRSVLNTSKHQDSVSIGEGQESPHRRPQFVRKKKQSFTGQEYEKALEITESTKSRLAAADSTAEEEQDLEEEEGHTFDKKKTKKDEASALSNVLNESDKSVRRSVLNTSKHLDSASIGEGQESPRRSSQFFRKKQQTLTGQEYEKAKSHLAAEAENVLEEVVEHFPKEKMKVNVSALSNVMNVSRKSVQRSTHNTSKHQDSGSLEDEPETPSRRPFFGRKKNSGSLHEFEKVLENNDTIESRLASEIENDLEKEAVEKPKEKTRKVNASVLSDMLNESQKSVQRNTSKHQDNASVDDEPESSLQRLHLGLRTHSISLQDLEVALDAIESAKSRLGAVEEDALIEEVVQHFLEEKTRKINASALSNILNESRKSVQHATRNTSKHNESGSIGDEPESTPRRRPFGRKKHSMSWQDLEKALESTESTKSHLAEEVQNNLEEEAVEDSPKEKMRKVDASAPSNALNKSQKSVERSTRNTSKHKDITSDEDEPESPRQRSLFGPKKHRTVAGQEIEKALDTVVSTKSHMSPDSPIEVEGHLEKEAVQHFPKEKTRKVGDSGLSNSQESALHIISLSSQDKSKTHSRRRFMRIKYQIGTTKTDYEKALETTEQEEDDLEEEAEEEFPKEKTRKVDTSALSNKLNESQKSVEHSIRSSSQEKSRTRTTREFLLHKQSAGTNETGYE